MGAALKVAFNTRYWSWISHRGSSNKNPIAGISWVVIDLVCNSISILKSLPIGYRQEVQVESGALTSALAMVLGYCCGLDRRGR
jgi:hypothetical protein